MYMPLLLFEPLLTVLSVTIATLLCVYFMLVIDSAGFYNKELDLFEKNWVMKFTYCLNYFVFFWFVQFIVGCQHFVIAGTVSQWYFTRNKSKVRSPICNSFYNLIFFHLGTICLGSLMLTIIKLIRMVMRRVKARKVYINCQESDNIVLIALSYVYEFMMSLLEGIISFLNNNAYIVTAIDGLPLLLAGKRAVHLIFNNFGEHMASQTVGDLVIGSCKLFIFLPSFLVGIEMISSGLSLIVVLLLAILVSHVMMSTFETTVDTLFICYSIDSEENDGEERPYFMSENLIIAMVETKHLEPPKTPIEPQQV
ncbi:choline transporter-like protein 1 [Bradysia coprophila]|uniref:choline transporter-like protein 1 n=1 Tax=Bradysia coprophila TaxID=38358 RepID=UPI00187D92CD|nr:choline transporter-like protein 1 [Bradysia coprophila]